jgi:hypothetical protein
VANENNVTGWLQQNDYGKQALATRQTYGITLNFASTSSLPAFFDAKSNTVFFNQALEDRAAAGYFVHEMHHVRRNKTGQSLQSTSANKQAYVDAAVQEEIDGTVLQLFFILSLDFAGSMPPYNQLNDKNSAPMYKEFRDRCAVFFNTGMRETGDRSKALELERKKAELLVSLWIDGENRMEGAFHRLGVGVLTYRESYGRTWEADHRRP